MTPDEKQQRDRVVGEAFACRHALLAYAYGSLSDHALAEDVVQSTFLVVMDKYADFREGTSMLAWCRSIVRLKVFEALRERKRLVSTEDRLLQEAIDFAFEDAQETEHGGVRVARLVRLRHCVGLLPGRSSQLLEASLEFGRSYDDLSRSASMTVEAVRKSLYRIRQTLRACVAAGMEAES